MTHCLDLLEVLLKELQTETKETSYNGSGISTIIWFKGRWYKLTITPENQRKKGGNKKCLPKNSMML